MAVKIPQDVTREDRLIGPLTLKQFLYLLFGGGVIFLTYQYYSLQYLFLIEFLGITFVVAAFVLAMAFGRINGIGFATFMVNFIRFNLSPKQHIWDKDEEEALLVADTTTPIATVQTSQVKTKTPAASQLELLAKVLDTGGRMNEANINTDRIGNIGENITTVAEPSVEDVLKETDH